MSEVITNQRMRDFVHSNVSKTFGLSVQQVAEKAKGYGRFKSWLNSDISQIVTVLNKVKDNGVSPAFFASYEKTEGYNSSWGWLNHTSVNGDPVTDADSVSKWIVSQSKNTTDSPAWIDYANYKDFVPSDVKTAGNSDFKNMTSGSIGKVVIAGTAAATWEVYYPDGIKAEFNGVQNYGAPITNMMNTIVEWGGTISGDGGGGTNPDPTEPTEPEEPEEPPIIDDDNKTKEMLSKIFNILLFEKSKSLISNRFFNVVQVYSNMYQIQPTDEFYEIVKIEDVGDIEEPTEPVDPTEPTDPTDPTPTGDFYFPVKIQNGINFWNPPYSEPSKSLKEDMDYGGGRSGGRIHSGYDIGAGGGTHTIYAVRDGKVTHVEDRGTAGFVIAIQHTSDEYHSLYMHLLPNSNKVNVGQNIKAGTAIATMGSSGGNYAVHLHIEISPTGVFHSFDSTINAREYLKVTGDNKTDLKIP